MSLTAGVGALPSDVKAMAIRKVATFADFTSDNDPTGEHDFGSFNTDASNGARTVRPIPRGASPRATAGHDRWIGFRLSQQKKRGFDCGARPFDANIQLNISVC